jgi:hypothetical protein
MSILDGILGGNGNSEQQSSNSSDFGSVIGTSPAFGGSLNDLLHSSNSSTSDDGDSNSSEFTGLGSLDFGFAAPTVIGVSSSNDSQSASDDHGGNGGLLNGLL